MDQSNLVPRKVTKKVKSKLIKSTNLKEILQPNISFDDSGCFLNPKETLGFSGPMVCIRSVQGVLALCDFWDLEKSRISQKSHKENVSSNKINGT